MSDDLVKRLRDTAISGGYDIYGLHCDLEREAADRIEKLEAANLKQSLITVDHLSRIEKLKAALRSIAANACCDSCREAALVAREALDAK